MKKMRMFELVMQVSNGSIAIDSSENVRKAVIFISKTHATYLSEEGKKLKGRILEVMNFNKQLKQTNKTPKASEDFIKNVYKPFL